MCMQIAAQSPEARVNVWREGPSQSCREKPSFTCQTFAGEKNPHKRSSPPSNIWPTRLGRTILWGFLPVIYHLLVQNEPVNTWLIVLSNCSHWGLIYMRASQVFDQLPVCYCYGLHVMDQCEAYLYTVVCAFLLQPDSQFTLSVCTISILGGLGWDLNSSHVQT